MRYVILLALCLGACSKPSDAPDQAASSHDVAAPAAGAKSAASGAPAAIAVSVPKMAYSYKYAFVLPGTSIAKAQQAHVALCDQLGAARCQVLALDNQAADASISQATLKIRVASALARQFGAALKKAVSGAGGRAVSQSIAAEDVSKALSDTQARLRQREMLVERLTEVLRTRKGSVAELVEAERSVAAAQEEIDQARGWLAELQGRVAMSTIDIEYSAAAAAAGHVGNGIGDTFVASASAFLIGIGAILRLLIFLAPWLVLAALGWWLWRRLGARMPRSFGRGSRAEPPPS